MPPRKPKGKPRQPPPERQSEAALRVSRRGTVALNLAGLKLQLKSGWWGRLKWFLLLLASGGGVAVLRHYL